MILKEEQVLENVCTILYARLSACILNLIVIEKCSYNDG